MYARGGSWENTREACKTQGVLRVFYTLLEYSSNILRLSIIHFLENINSSKLNQRQLSWELAKKDCHLLQLSRHENDVTDALPVTKGRLIQESMSYWLGIHKNDTCKTHMVEDLVNVTESRFKCVYVENSNGTGRRKSCHEKYDAICVKHAGERERERFSVAFCFALV